MDFNYTDEQSMLADAVGRWLATDYGFARRRRLASGEESWDGNWRQLADLGLLGLNVPEDQGGMGGTSVDALIVMQALGRALVVEPYVQTALVSAPLLARAGSQEQRDQLLPQIVAGDCRVVVATLEPGARFDLDHVETRAVANGRRVRALRAEGRSSRCRKRALPDRLGPDVGCGPRRPWDFVVPRSGRLRRGRSQGDADD